MQKTSGSHSLLADDVLHLTVYGVLNAATLREAFASVRASGALLVDVTGAITDDMTTVELARMWRACVPPLPTALIPRQFHVSYWQVLAMRLASEPTFPAPLETFWPIERHDAIVWCRARAITFRESRARRSP